MIFFLGFTYLLVSGFLDRFWAGLTRDLVRFKKEYGGLWGGGAPPAEPLFSPVWAIGFCRNQWPKRSNACTVVRQRDEKAIEVVRDPWLPIEGPIGHQSLQKEVCLHGVFLFLPKTGL